MDSEETTPPMRIGIGYDIHRIEKGRRCVLGGVEIPSNVGSVAHSDGDVLAHALADAILGAVGLPDIGHYFPPNDSACEGIDSMEILSRAEEEARRLGYRIGNVDVSVIAERPKIGTYVLAMRKKLGNVLGIAPACVGIKATTNEKLGALGAGEGIAVHAVCLLFKK